MHEGEEECLWDFGKKAIRKSLDEDRRTILRWFLERENVVIWTGLIWLRTR
jgi:hypothetical protein